MTFSYSVSSSGSGRLFYPSINISASTHNLLCLAFVLLVSTLLLRELFATIEVSYGKGLINSRCNEMLVDDQEKVPEIIVVHLEDSAPIIKLMPNLVQPHLIELIGNSQDLSPTPLRSTDLPVYISLPSVEQGGGLMTYDAREHSVRFKLNIESKENCHIKLFTLLGVERKVIKRISHQNSDGIGIAELFSNISSNDPLPFKFGRSESIDGDHSGGYEIFLQSNDPSSFDIELRDRFPITVLSLSGTRSHMVVFDTLGRGGNKFTPEDMRTLRLYLTQEYLISTPTHLTEWLREVEIVENKQENIYSISLTPTYPDCIFADLVTNMSTKRPPSFLEDGVEHPVTRPLERFGYDEEESCIVCLDQKTNVTLLPCRHSPVCSQCLLGIRKSQCPICRSALDGFLKFTDLNHEAREMETRYL